LNENSSPDCSIRGNKRGDKKAARRFDAKACAVPDPKAGHIAVLDTVRTAPADGARISSKRGCRTPVFGSILLHEIQAYCLLVKKYSPKLRHPKDNATVTQPSRTGENR
jgi:hypothetical protein